MELTEIHMIKSVAVEVPKQDAGSFGIGLGWDRGLVPRDGLFGSDPPDYSLGGFGDLGHDDDVFTSFDGGGINNWRCSRRRGEAEGQKESGKELHCGSS